MDLTIDVMHRIKAELTEPFYLFGTFACLQAELMFLRQKWDQVHLETQEQEKQLIESYKTRIKVISFYIFSIL